MKILNRLLGREKDDPRPPKPDSETKSKRRECTVYEAEIEYRNGDTETFECYYKQSNGSVVEFAVSVATGYGRYRPRFDHTHRTEAYEVLDREPKITEKRAETWEMRYEIDHKWNHRGHWEETYDVKDLQRVKPESEHTKGFDE